jgi:hypothetical protein
MRKSGSNVQKLDVSLPALFRWVPGTLQRIRQSRETWNLNIGILGLKASREHVETTAEMSDGALHDRS